MRHGGNIREAENQFGFQPGEMLDLSTGICPRPYPIPEILLDSREFRGLPQREDEEALESAFRHSLHVPNEAAVLASPGSQALISLAPFLGKAVPVSIPDPAYSEHTLAWTRAGWEVDRYPAGDLLSIDTPSAVVVQPGNPLGEEYNPDDVLDLVEKADSRNGIVVVDEAFADSNPSISLLPWAGRPGLLVLRSFGKFHGLAGLRLGFAAGHDADISRLKAMLGPWPVSTLALKIGVSALADKAFQKDQREWIRERHTALKELLGRHGLDIAGGTELFAVLELEDAAGLHRDLAEAGIWTRIFEDHTNLIRIGLPDEAGLGRLDAALLG